VNLQCKLSSVHRHHHYSLFFHQLSFAFSLLQKQCSAAIQDGVMTPYFMATYATDQSEDSLQKRGPFGKPLCPSINSHDWPPYESQDSSVSIVTSLQAKQPRNHGLIPGKGTYFLQSVQTGCVAHTASCSVGNVSTVIARSWSLTLSSAIVKHQWSMLLRIFPYSQ
jgi:hypothetical protein